LFSINWLRFILKETAAKFSVLNLLTYTTIVVFFTPETKANLIKPAKNCNRELYKKLIPLKL